MSLVKLIKAQFGKSNTPANNFTLDASADNGTMKLARGNADATTQDILTVDASGKVTFPQNVQVIQDVKASRVVGTNYTNSTGQPITVMVSGSSSAVAAIAAIVDGITLYGSSAGIGALSAITFVVPSGKVYQVGASAGTLTTASWVELR